MLEVLTQPEALAGARYVRKLCRELAAIDVPEQCENVAELHALAACAGKTAGKELGIEVVPTQTEEVELEHGRHVAAHEPQRVDIGDLMTAQAVDLDQARYRCLLLDRRHQPAARFGGTVRLTRFLQPFADRSQNGPVGHVAKVAAQRLEESPPYGRDSIGRLEIILVQRFDEGSVRSLERG